MARLLLMGGGGSMSQASLHDHSILIVEDQAIIAWDLSERLTHLGYDVRAIADNSDDAVQYAQELRPSLVFMDIILRGKEDGIQAAQRIQERMDVPIVFLTAHADTATIERAMRAAPYGYLVKPFDERDIRTTAEIAISRHRAALQARFLEVAFQDAHLGVVVLEAHSKNVIYKNRPFSRMFGRPFVEPYPNERLVLPTPESQRGIRDKLMDAIQNSQPFTGDIEVLRPDGTSFWDRIVLSLVRDGGVTTHLLLQHTDITEEKVRDTTLYDLDRRLNDLRKSNAQLSFYAQVHSALEAAPNMVEACKAGLRLIGEWVTCSSAAAFDLRGQPTVIASWGEPPSKAWPELAHIRDRLVAPEPGYLDMILPLQRMEMALIWRATREDSLQERQSRLFELLSEELERGLEHWWVERQLRETERRRALVYQHAFHAVISTDGDGRVVEYNAAAARLLGLDSVSVGASVLRHLVVDMSFAELCQTSHHECHVTLPDGQRAVVEIAVVRTDAPVWTFFVNDITVRHNAQVAMEAARNSAMEADQAKSDFVASMSHEIRTPLNAVLGMADIALHSSSPAEIRACLERIQHNGDALLGLLNGVLDFSKINAGQLELEERSFDMWDLVGAVAEGLASRAYQKGLEIRALVNPEVPGHLVGDQQRVRQVLVNLLSNAIKFTDRGSVELAVDLSAEATPRLMIQVRDTGIGISAADQEQLFNRFFRAERTRSYAGTGLGLTISRSLVLQMGGEITVESARGVGTTFRVLLPLRRVPNHVADPVHRVPGEIWIYSSDPVEQAELLRHVEAGGYTAVALENVRPSGVLPELIIADLEAEERLRPYRSAGVKVVGITRLGSGATGEGVDDLLHRPFGPRRILARLRSHVAQPSMPPLVQAAGLSGRSRPILVVDDSQDNWMVVQKYLKGMGFSVEVATDGRQAVEMTERRDYALVVMDIDMPVMDGMEATAAIRLREKRMGHLRTPVIALTAHATKDVEQRCREVGFDDYHTKPVGRRILKSIVDSWVDPTPLVMVVDDTPDMRHLLSRFLENGKRFRVLTAADAEAAHRLMERYLLDLAFLDLEMPGVGGRELLAQLRRAFPSTMPRVTALTGHQDPEIRRACMAEGFDEFLTKPVDRNTLQAVARRLLEKAV
jgi:CheY-like chemotaxis protein/signal transduction histidine kinase